MRVPATLQQFVDGCEWDSVQVGKSGASVFRLKADAGTLFLKICSPEVSDLRAEAERLRWLAGRLPVPEVILFDKDKNLDYLLVRGLPGVNGVEMGHKRPHDVTVGLAHALRALHRQPVSECPFDQTVPTQIERARQRVARGLVNEADFDEERIGRSAADLLDEADRTRPKTEICVLTHGDACLPNAIFDGPQFSGFIDCSRAGTADPYQDLALAARSIESNFGREWVPVFFTQYGLSDFDEGKAAFYRLLDEFF